MAIDKSKRPGATIVLMLLLLVLVFTFVAIAIDLGRIQLAQLKLQGAADFASRAGAEAMARGVGTPNSQASFESAIRDEVAMVMNKTNTFGQPIGFDRNTQISFGNASNSGGKFIFTPTANGQMDSITNSLKVLPDLTQFPLMFGSFLGQESVALRSRAAAKVMDRDIVLVLDKSTSMLTHDAGTIAVADYNANLLSLEDAMFGPGDEFHPSNRPPGSLRHTEFEINNGRINLSRTQALKLAILKFRQQIDITRGVEQLGLTAYSGIANVPANAPTAPGPIDIVAGLSPAIVSQIAGTGVTPVNPDGTQHITERNASALEGEATGYDNFDYNYLRMRRHAGTNIADGIIKGADVLNGPRKRTFATPILIVMTDGRHNKASTPEAAATTVMASYPNSVIYTITFGDGAEQSTMQNVADIGNGRHLHAADVAQLIAIFEDLATNAGVVIIE